MPVAPEPGCYRKPVEWRFRHIDDAGGNSLSRGSDRDLALKTLVEERIVNHDERHSGLSLYRIGEHAEQRKPLVRCAAQLEHLIAGLTEIPPCYGGVVLPDQPHGLRHVISPAPAAVVAHAQRDQRIDGDAA